MEWTSTKPLSLPASHQPTSKASPATKASGFPPTPVSCVAVLRGLQRTTARTCAWNPQETYLQHSGSYLQNCPRSPEVRQSDSQQENRQEGCYYDLKFKEVNKYQHKRALVLTARKGAELSLVLPFCRLHRAFALLFFKIFLHYLLDFISLDFSP